MNSGLIIARRASLIPAPAPVGVTFGTPVINNMASRTSYTLPMTGVISGQPIFVTHYGWGTQTPTLSDNFSTPYTWTQVEVQQNNGQDLWLYIGTGGAGTSGTITVSWTGTQTFGGSAVACIDASTASGLSALDGHSSNTSGASKQASWTSPALTPSTAGEGAIYAEAGGGVEDLSSPWTNADINNGATIQAVTSVYPSPPSGSGLTATWTSTNNWYSVSIAALVKHA